MGKVGRGLLGGLAGPVPRACIRVFVLLLLLLVVVEEEEDVHHVVCHHGCELDIIILFIIMIA